MYRRKIDLGPGTSLCKTHFGQLSLPTLQITMRSQAQLGTKCKTRLGWATRKCKRTQHEYSVHFFKGCYHLQFAFCSEAGFLPQNNVPLGVPHAICILYWENGSAD